MEFDYAAIRKCLRQDSRVVRLPAEGRAVFVGDTHGDVEATRRVLDTYFKPGYTLVFLGDYVDRGPASRENISLLLNAKLEVPDRLFLLMGNHEGYPFEELHPADFWEGLSAEEMSLFGDLCGLLPYVAVSDNGLIALHGAPPELTGPGELHGVEAIAPGSNAWNTLVWGDFAERARPAAFTHFWGRPTFGRDYFDTVMNQYDRTVLIRAHQRDIPVTVFDQRCLTIMTSRALKVPRRIGIADLEGPEIRSARDLLVIALD
jgi:hypothetical protein